MDREILQKLRSAAREEVAARLRGGQVSPETTEMLIRDTVNDVAQEWDLYLARQEFESLAQSIVDDFLYYGPLQPLLEDVFITEIMVNGGGVEEGSLPSSFLNPIVYVERAGLLEYRPDVVFDDAAHVRRIINKIAEQAGMRCDESHAMGCAMLPGGRVRATYVVPPISPDGPALNLRTFSAEKLTINDLISAGALSVSMAEFLCSAVQARCPLLISGGTGSGKTTLLGALSAFISSDERIITIEDTPELRLFTPHLERMCTREANAEGEGAVSVRDLVVMSLRRRPDRIVVGECRGAEAYDMLQAMQTDHSGSMTTIHANDPNNALNRLRTMVGYADGDLNCEVITQQIAESLQGGLIVHTQRLQDGSRKIVSIVAIDSLPEGSAVIPRMELFSFEEQGLDGQGMVLGVWRASGVQPQGIKKRIQEAGINYEPHWFFEQGKEFSYGEMRAVS